MCQIRCDCGHQAGYRDFEVREPTEDQRRLYAYQTGHDLIVLPRWRCPVCETAWSILPHAQGESTVSVFPRAQSRPLIQSQATSSTETTK